MTHEHVNPPDLGPAIGFSHAVVAAEGRLVFLAGQTAHGPDGALRGQTLVEQFDAALANLATAMRAAGAEPEHLVQATIYTTQPEVYRERLGELGASWRRHLGRHYPALTLAGVTELFDPGCLVEVVGIAVVPGS
jgi:enamine deaminase RidA (YjgF/YER057c/UK114 family)